MKTLTLSLALAGLASVPLLACDYQNDAGMAPKTCAHAAVHGKKKTLAKAKHAAPVAAAAGSSKS